MFSRAWRREKGDYPSLFAMLASNLSEECRLRRRRLVWALAAFFGFLALVVIAHFGVYGSDPQKHHRERQSRWGCVRCAVTVERSGISAPACSSRNEILASRLQAVS